MKKYISLFLTLALCLSFFSANVSANYSSASANDPVCFVSKRLIQNATIMDEVFGENAQHYYDTESYAQISVSLDRKSATLTLSYDGTISTAVLSGTFETVNVTNGSGYVGVYEGYISPIRNRTLELNENGQLPIIADVTFTDSDIFAVITLGYASETKKPIILFYGDYSTRIANISKSNAARSLEEAQLQKAAEDEGMSVATVNGTCKFQGSAVVYLGSKMAGVLSVFHASELRNQGNMSTYVKVNTKSSLVENYIKDDMGFGSYTIAAYPDTFNISICGNNNNFHAVTNSYIPQNNSKSATINIPVYGGSVVGLQFIPFKVTMSSTTVTTSRYSSSSQHPNNKLSWKIYRKNGWNPDTFDGGYSSKAGMTVASTYTYEGNVKANVTRSMTATGSIRYEYWIMIMGNLSSYHLSTNRMSKTTNVTIRP